MSEKYNGWTNYETWNWKLWIDNEERSYRHWQDRAETCYAEAVADEDEFNRDDWTFAAAKTLREELEAECDEAIEALGMKSGPLSDILTAAVREINWHEIAVSLVEDLDRDGIEAEVLPAPQ